MSWLIDIQNPKTVLGDLLCSVPDLKFRSGSALQDLYKTLISTLIKVLKGELKKIEKEVKLIRGTTEDKDLRIKLIREKGGLRAKLTRYIRRLMKETMYLSNDRDRLLAKIYETILESEDLGLLRGFGMANKFGDSIVGNPERQSVKPQIIPFKKERIIMKTKDLQKVAKELNELMGLDPEIDVDAEEEDLKAKILEAAEQLTDDDKVSKLAEGIIDELKEEAADAAPEEKEEKPPKGKAKSKPGIKANGKASKKEKESAPEKKTPPAKATKAEKPAPVKGKGKEKGESFAAFVARLVQKKTPEKEIVKQFTTLYTERKGKADADFIKGRVDIYTKLANK
jgi:hypothetical protein